MHNQKLGFLSVPYSCTDVKANAHILYNKSIQVMTQAVINYKQRQSLALANSNAILQGGVSEK